MSFGQIALRNFFQQVLPFRAVLFEVGRQAGAEFHDAVIQKSTRASMDGPLRHGRLSSTGLLAAKPCYPAKHEFL